MLLPNFINFIKYTSFSLTKGLYYNHYYLFYDFFIFFLKKFQISYEF